jgi:carboxypeptidase Q
MLLVALAALTLAASPPEAPARLVGTILVEGRSQARLAELADLIGPRLSGSPGAAAAVQWAQASFRQDGLAPWTEPVRVPRWVRGAERASLAVPAPPQPRSLAITALGNSAGTPPGGLTAEVLEVDSLEAARALGPRAAGKVLLFQHHMAEGLGGYGESVALRTRGPAEAARLGAVAALVRSLATASLRSPHTGTTTFPPGVAPIPAAAVSVEDAELLHRLLRRGPVKVHLELECGPGSPAEVDSANVVAEVRGRERPQEVVLLGAHLDSWDLADGAVDDGAGVVMVMEALRALQALPVAPRRTVRVVLFMNEENGLQGGVAYAERHAGEVHVAALEADSGAGRALAVEVGAADGGTELMARLTAPLQWLGLGPVSAGGGGADTSPLKYQGVPMVTLKLDTSRYFDWHHSAADTFDKVEGRELALDAAGIAVLAWQLAESPEVLPRPEPPAEAPRSRPAGRP